MKRILATAAIVGLVVTGTSYAAEPLTDQQMDTVTAGSIVVVWPIAMAMTPVNAARAVTTGGISGK